MCLVKLILGSKLIVYCVWLRNELVLTNKYLITWVRKAKEAAVCGMPKWYQWHDRCSKVCRSSAASYRRVLWLWNGELLEKIGLYMFFCSFTMSAGYYIIYIRLVFYWFYEINSLFVELLLHLQETFEFLNILQIHGFPKVMGVLTHLDKFKDAKKLRKRKQNLKHRFWTEIYDGAKLFYLSGLIHGK